SHFRPHKMDILIFKTACSYGSLRGDGMLKKQNMLYISRSTLVLLIVMTSHMNPYIKKVDSIPVVKKDTLYKEIKINTTKYNEASKNALIYRDSKKTPIRNGRIVNEEESDQNIK